MASNKTIWTIFGIILVHYYAMVTAHSDVTKNEDAVKEVNDAGSNPNSYDNDDKDIGTEFDVVLADSPDTKRHIGRWKNANANWSQRGGKRYTTQLESSQEPSNVLSPRVAGQEDLDHYYRHSIQKRFSDYYDENNDFDRFGNVNADAYEQVDLGERQFKYPYPNALTGYVDKRQASRWNLIHRKLMQLSRDGKRSFEYQDASKRSPSRWRLIQQKINQLERGNINQSKRFVGRWKNQNWLLQRANQEHQQQKSHSLS